MLQNLGPFKARAESFGGVVCCEDPPLLLAVDRAWCLDAGLDPGIAWCGTDGYDWSAPLEVHAALSRRCDARCPSCYMSATPDGAVLDKEAVEKIVDICGDAGVFQIALGGGEVIDDPLLYYAAERARSRGMVPNCTTGGRGLTKKLAAQCRIFGQVNVSVDGDALTHSANRGTSYGDAISAIEMLKEAGVSVGINCVVTRSVYESLDNLLALADDLGVVDVELLRFKPSGRGSDEYEFLRCTDAQHRGLLPKLDLLRIDHRVRIKIDCSFIPMLCWHNPDPEALKLMGVYGCEAGGVLGAITPEGRFAGCSFIEPVADPAVIVQGYASAPELAPLRNRMQNLGEPCTSCDYLSLCKGGCMAVSAWHGNAMSPDPECPRIVKEYAV